MAWAPKFKSNLIKFFKLELFLSTWVFLFKMVKYGEKWIKNIKLKREKLILLCIKYSVVGWGCKPNSTHNILKLILSTQPHIYLPIDLIVYGLKYISMGWKNLPRVAVGWVGVAPSTHNTNKVFILCYILKNGH
jgi:hypothetical protein